MALTVDQFGKALVSAGLFTADELKALWNAIPADARPKLGDGFAKLLVQQGKLNQFQADELLSGRNTPLVMGDYVLVAELGAGGMGKVYKARHRRMERIVALKVMSAAAMQDEAAVKRFQREVKAAARLEHSNIVTAYDSGETGKVKYLVMQFVDGGDLSQLVKQSGPLEIERAVDYVLQAARGLAFAHGEGVVHRDIKPANLLLDKKGVVKILDMGLARIEGGDGLTATEQVMGTVDYMSPEQAANTKTADGRSDIYSLGCTLWFLLTAKKLYDGDTMISRLMSHRTDPLPSLVKARDDVPWSLEQAFHKMIAKLPEERFQSMDEVVAALEPFSPSGGSRPGMGSSIGMGPQNAELASFLKSVGPAVKPQTKPAPTGTKVEVEATAQFAAAGADTDPKSEILPPAHKAATGGRGPAAQPQAKGSGKKPPPNKNLILAAAGGGALLVLLGVWFIFRGPNGEEIARVQIPAGGSVTVQQPASTAGKTPVATATRPISFFLPNSTPASSSGTTTPSSGAPPPAVPSSNGVVYLDDLTEKSYFGLFSLQKPGRNPQQAAELSKQFPDGSPVHAMVLNGNETKNDKLKDAVPSMSSHNFAASVTYDLAGKYASFQSGFRARSKDLVAEVWGDGKRLWESGGFVPTEPAGTTADIDVRGVRGVRDLMLLIWSDASSNFGVSVLLIEPRLTTVGIAAPPSGATVGNAPPLAKAPFNAATALKHQAAWAQYLREPVETTNSLGMKFVVIPPGEFLMGDKESMEGQVPVTLTKPFRLGIHEVTREQWRAVVGKDSGFYAADRGENCAANNMSQEVAVEFCQKLTNRERAAGRLPADAAYRLPTEAEWEWACRAGTTTAYSFGEDQALLGQYAWFKDCTGGKHYAWPVGRLKPNPWGLYDMYGNVKERCHDRVQAQLTGGVDPQGTSEGKKRMLRGGEFVGDAASCRTGFRKLDTTSFGKDTTTGFRVALSRTGSGVPPQAGLSTTDSGTPPSASAPPTAAVVVSPNAPRWPTRRSDADRLQAERAALDRPDHFRAG